MSHSLPDDVDTQVLDELTLSDLVSIFDETGTDAVEEFLTEGFEVATEFLRDHGKELSDVPTAVYDPLESGVAYDPYHDRGEALIIGGPRGLLRGGEQVLRDHGLLSQKTLLSILCKGLLHSYNNELATEHFDGTRDIQARTGRGSVELFDTFQMVSPAVDEGITQLFVLYLHGDVTDRDLRDAYIEAWIDWYRRKEFDTDLFGAVAYAIGDRIDDAEGDRKERLVRGLGIQEPLIRNGDVSVLGERLGRIG